MSSLSFLARRSHSLKTVVLEEDDGCQVWRSPWENGQGTGSEELGLGRVEMSHQDGSEDSQDGTSDLEGGKRKVEPRGNCAETGDHSSWWRACRRRRELSPANEQDNNIESLRTRQVARQVDLDVASM